MTDTSASRVGDHAGFPLLGYSPTKSASENSSPSSSRIRIARLPFGNAARATRAVSSGTPPIFLTCNDTDTLLVPLR
jgi:hypothetical protein